MKQKVSKKTSPSAEPLSPINTLQYLGLTAEEKKLYRPVNPAYERLPLVCRIFYLSALFSLVIYIIACISPDFADFFNQYVSVAGRSLLNILTRWIPFSLGELTVFLLPVALVLAVAYAIRRRCDTWRCAWVFVSTLLSVLAALFSIFVLNFGTGYRGTPLDQKLGLERQAVSAQELYDTAEILREHLNREADDIQYAEDGFSQMPYDLDTLNRKLNEAYRDFDKDHDFITHVDGTIKPVMISEAMSYMHITGVYSFFTGEANLNVNFPDYTLPYTAAHEMAHQRGIAREDEANFIAYLVCISSEDPYIRYSGYMNMYEYMIGALASADYKLFATVSQHVKPEVNQEIRAFNEFFKKYADSTISKVSGTINDTFLQSQGTPGIKSYGLVVDLAVAYYKESPPVME